MKHKLFCVILDQDQGPQSLSCCFFFLAFPVEPTRMLHIHNIVEKENINVEKMLFTSKLKPSRSHRTHIYRIF